MSPEEMKKVLNALKKIPEGRVTTYKDLGRALGMHPRKVAVILSKNPAPLLFPCHRVVHSDGRIGGYTPHGSHVKARILEVEGVPVRNGRIPDLEKFLHEWVLE